MVENCILNIPLFKILLLGESNVGKTSLKIRFVDDSFPIDYKPTVGVDYKIKLLKIDEKECVKLSIWDTAGQERYRSIAKSYMNNCQGVILCFDISDRNSFSEISNYWIEFVKNNLANEYSKNIILVGTKLDKQNQRKVSNVEAKKLAENLDIEYIETSAMKNINVEEIFLGLSKIILKNLEVVDKNDKVNLEPFTNIQSTSKVVKGKKCC